MTERLCHGPVRAATGDAFTDDQIEALIERVRRARAKRGAASPDLDDEDAWKAALADEGRAAVHQMLVDSHMKAHSARATAGGR